MLTAPEPNSAPKFELWIFTSWTMSLFTPVISPQLHAASTMFEPSRLTVLPVERMPLTVYAWVLFAPPKKLTLSS